MFFLHMHVYSFGLRVQLYLYVDDNILIEPQFGINSKYFVSFQFSVRSLLVLMNNSGVVQNSRGLLAVERAHQGASIS